MSKPSVVTNAAAVIVDQAPAPSPSTTPLIAPELVDEFFDLYSQEKIHKPRREELAKLLRAAAKDCPKERKTFQGKRSLAVVKPAKIKRQITDRLAVFRTLGKTVAERWKKLLEICTFPLEELDKILTEEERKAFILEDQTGSREVEAFALPPKTA